MEQACADGVTQNSEATVGDQKGELVRARALLTDALNGGHVSTVYGVAVRGRWLFSAAGDAAVKVRFAGQYARVPFNPLFRWTAVCPKAAGGYSVRPEKP